MSFMEHCMDVTLISLLILLARGITFGDMFFICIINVFRNTKPRVWRTLGSKIGPLALRITHYCRP